uniref:Adhesion G protein-coupled receptor F5 n=1 Tax=Lepisosteus oculatus TaxID=7918 RepID=W5NIB7_LEPOC|nr:PREDICTED: adhesion G protein-coupled receptor F5-like isoform X1 [Lepisosteus oculatus]
MAIPKILLYSAVLLLACEISTAQPWFKIPGWSSFQANKAEQSVEKSPAHFRQKRETSPLEYIVDIELNVSDKSIIEQLKTFMNTLFPIHITNIFNITGANVTTVCTQSGNEIRCECENNYVWSFDNCTKYGSCSNISGNTCTCIKNLPPDGLFCQPRQFSAIRMSFKINGEFNEELKNTSSSLYQTYVTDITKGITGSYGKFINGFNGVKIIGFTRGSVITEYEVTALGITSSAIQKANTQLVANLVNSSYSVIEDSFTARVTDQTTFTMKPDILYPGDNMELTCELNQPYSNTVWELNDIPLQGERFKQSNGSSFTKLQVNSVTGNDNGTYECIFKDGLIEYVSNKTVLIQQQPSVTLTSPGNVYCDGITRLKCCVVPVKALNVSWIKEGTLTVNENKSFNETEGCLINEITPTSGNCSQGQTRSKLTYTCEVTTGNGANFQKNSTLIFVQVGNVTLKIDNTVYQSYDISEGYEFNMNCTSDSQFDSVNWYLKENGQNDFSPLIAYNAVLNVKTPLNGTYRCELLFGAQNRIAETTVTVHPLPQITLSNPRLNVLCQTTTVTKLECCAQNQGFQGVWIENNNKLQTAKIGNCFQHNYTMTPCQDEIKKEFICMVFTYNNISSVNSTLTIIYFTATKGFCTSAIYGNGTEGSTAIAACPEGQQGQLQAICKSGIWTTLQDNCVLAKINTILTSSEQLLKDPALVQIKIPQILNELNDASTSLQKNITNSAGTINAVVKILSAISAVSGNTTVNATVMENFIATVDVIISPESVKSWISLNNQNETLNSSSNLLFSVERFTGSLSSNTTVSITRKNIDLQSKIINNGTYSSTFTNTSNQIEFPDTLFPPDTTVTSILFFTLSEILPTRNINNSIDANKTINADITSVNVKNKNGNVSIDKAILTFQVNNTSLDNPLCVFWNFLLFNKTGGWDSTGCQLQTSKDGTVSCFCNHLTSFSILMSPSFNFPESIRILLDFITYIGVGISMLSLVLCLLIEAFVWSLVTKNSTSYMRHVTIVNIAISLLIADIWFMIGAAINTYEVIPVPSCRTTTWFIHYFYLALFFWMFASALLLFYRTMLVFSHLSKAAMLGIAFSLGYGCPFIIAMTTIIATAPQNHYTVENVCWLNWNETKALLAFVIPALAIVAINFLILLAVIFKMLRRGVGEGSHTDEKNALHVIVRCVAILTPLFGLTWGFGIGLMVSPGSVGLNVVFAVLNSFQGFFILVFGILLDSKIRSAIFRRFSFVQRGSQQTRSTSGGTSSSGNRFNVFKRRRRMFNVAEATSSSQSATESFINT